MIGQNLTRFTLVMLLVGVILALAVFRPPILPADVREPDDETGHVEETTPLLTPDENGLVPAGKRLVPEKVQAESRGNDLTRREGELDQREQELDQREAELDELQSALKQREARLDEHAAAVEEWERDTRTHLWAQEADLAAWEAKVQRLQYWSVAALVGSGLLAVPSILVLVALRRQDQRTPGKEVGRARASQARQEKRSTRHGGLATVTPAPTYGGNGRGKQSVGHRV
jgi:hypothetical protein